MDIRKLTRNEKIGFTFYFIILVPLCLVIIPSIGSVIASGTNSLNNTQFIAGHYNPNTDTIVIYENNSTISYKIAYEHELCHREQHYRNDTRALFVREIECNIKEWNGLLK